MRRSEILGWAPDFLWDVPWSPELFYLDIKGKPGPGRLGCMGSSDCSVVMTFSSSGESSSLADFLENSQHVYWVVICVASLPANPRTLKDLWE